MDLFVFGTMLHLPLLAEVSGVADIAGRAVWAVRRDHAVLRDAKGAFAVMHPQAGAVAEGMIVQGLTDEAIARLDYYEGAFGCARAPLVVLDGNQTPRDAVAYVPAADRVRPAVAWDRDGWAAAFGEVTTMAAREAMTLMGQVPAADMARHYPNIMARAASRHRAGSRAVAPGMTRNDVTLIEARRPYAGFFNVEELDLTFRRFDGAMSEPVNRAVFVGVDAAIVLPYDPARDRVLLVEQFRPGAYLRGDPNPWTIEPIAGRIDAVETPEDAARREAHEEAGITLRDLHCVAAAYPSPGSTSEHFFVYVGLCDLPGGVAGIGGEASEAEDIRSHVMDYADFDLALNAGAFRVLPLLVAGHWLARNRARLRSLT